jgi:hypothetical protein
MNILETNVKGMIFKGMDENISESTAGREG